MKQFVLHHVAASCVFNFGLLRGAAWAIRT